MLMEYDFKENEWIKNFSLKFFVTLLIFHLIFMAKGSVEILFLFKSIY